MGYCQDEIDNYNALVGMSLLLTLCVFVMKRRGVGSAIFYFSLGIIKIIFGLLLITIFNPEDCANFSNFYGVIAIFIGLQWIYHGDQVASSTPPAGAVAIPAASTLIEMETVHPMDINTIAPEQMQEPDSDTKSCYSDHCTYLIPMLGWFVFSGLLSLYNKYVYGWTRMAFPCPLLMTSFHFLIQFIWSYTLSSIYPITFGGDQVDAMSWNTYLSVAIPCGLVTSLDVGLSNVALVRITMTFYNMVKSSSPIFVVISAYCFGIEKITPALILTVLVISAGEMLTVIGEVEFDMIGFILVLSAAILSGMRWTVVQLKLQTLEPKLRSTVATMRILSPFMLISMLMLSFMFEEPWNKFGANNHSGTTYFAGPWDILWTVGLGLFGATLAICMITCEFYLIMESTAVILMIGGVLKELTTILLGVSVMGDQLNTTNALGVLVVFSGVMLYKVSHYMDKKEKVYDTVDMESNGSAALYNEYSQKNSFSDDGDANGNGNGIGNGENHDHDGPFSLDYDDYGDDNGLEEEQSNTSGTISKINKRRRKKSRDSKQPGQRPLVESEDAEII